MDSGSNRLRMYLDALSHDQWMAVEGLAVVTVLYATSQECKHAWEGNGFLSALHDTAATHTFMALARLLDDDKKSESVTIIGVCNYVEQNVEECEWLFSSEGRQTYPSPEEEIQRRCRHWRNWVQELSVRTELKQLRDKSLAHRDKKHVLGELQLKAPMLHEIREVIRAVGSFVNQFTELTHSSETQDWALYQQIVDDGVLTLSTSEAMQIEANERRSERLWSNKVAPISDNVKAALTRLEQLS
jgi:hypothetical protein